MGNLKRKMERDAEHNANPLKPIRTVTVQFFSNGTLSLSGFPNGLDNALVCMDAAKNAVVKYFIDAAKEGRLDDQGYVAKKRITEPGVYGGVKGSGMDQLGAPNANL